MHENTCSSVLALERNTSLAEEIKFFNCIVLEMRIDGTPIKIHVMCSADVYYVYYFSS